MEKKDKIPTKPADKAQKSYIVRSIAFSPDGTKLAVAQSDNIVFVYKIGEELPCQKKTICNKFLQTSSVTCMTWPRNSPDKLIFGLADGKVVAGLLKQGQKSDQLINTGSYVVSISHIPGSNMVVCGFYDLSIYVINYENNQTNKIVVHTSIP